MLNQAISSAQMPGLIWWKKNHESIYTEVNDECANLFGFQKAQEMVGIRDKDLRCKVCEEAEICLKSDQEVMLTQKSLCFIRASQYAKNEQKILLINKSPITGPKNTIIGTFAYCIDLTKAIDTLSNLLSIKQIRINKGSNLVTNKYFAGFKCGEVALTERQSECLFFLLRGKTVKEIAKFLNLSPRTVEDHIEALKLKFACQNKHELVAAAIERGLLNMIPKRIFEIQLFLAL